MDMHYASYKHAPCIHVNIWQSAQGRWIGNVLINHPILIFRSWSLIKWQKKKKYIPSFGPTDTNHAKKDRNSFAFSDTYQNCTTENYIAQKYCRGINLAQSCPSYLIAMHCRSFLRDPVRTAVWKGLPEKYIIPSEMEVAPHPQNCWYHTEHKTI